MEFLGLIAGCLLATLTPGGVAKAAPAAYPHPPAAPSPSADTLLSRRARRREALLLRMKLDELRLAELERARAAVQRTLSIDELIYGKPKR